MKVKLNEKTAQLANGVDAVCAFVNDTINAQTIDLLNQYGVQVIAMRCSGYNNIDMKAAYKKNTYCPCANLFSICSSGTYNGFATML